MPTVSIILPTHNRAHCLDRAIRSILIQSFQEWELIVVDDGSTDATPALCQSFSASVGDRFRYFRLNNCGVSSARNFGIKQARGGLIAFQDSDDYWCRDKLGLQVAALKRERNALFSFTNFSLFHEGHKPFQEKQYFPAEFSGHVYPDLYRIKYNLVVTPSVVCSRNLLIGAGGFDRRMDMCEDIDLWGRLTARTRAVAIDKPLVGVHVRLNEEYPYRKSFVGRKVLYTKAVARDPRLRGTLEAELFAELFTVFRDLALRDGYDHIASSALDALELVQSARTSGDESKLVEAVALMESGLDQFKPRS